MKHLFIIYLVCFSTAAQLLSGAPQTSMTSSVNELPIEKSHYLEIAYGIVDEDVVSITTETVDQVTASFLENATILRIATSPTDSGAFEEVDRYKLEFLLTEQDDGRIETLVDFRLTQEGRHRAINTRVLLNESKWFVLSGLSSVTSDAPPLSYITALRIVPRENNSSTENSE